jgi:mannosyltransferase OCH1-like enzyme
MQRIDAMKYFLLFHFGRIYIDLDIPCNAKDLLTAMILKNQTEYELNIIFHMDGEGISANTDIMVAKQLHPFFK